MSENKLDRTNLKRQAQRVESYSALVSKRRDIFKSDTLHMGHSRIERYQKLNYFNADMKEYEEENKRKCNSHQCSSPSSENLSSSSDSSQEFHQSLHRNWKSVKTDCKREEDTCLVMTRSATRKYASVGAIHNRVHFEDELKIKRKWPVSVCYPPPNLSTDNLRLKDVVTRSLNYVMSFCKYATSQQDVKKQVEFDLEKSVNFIDLSPYLSQEPMTENGDHETQVTLHLNESVLSHQFINVISISNEEQCQALVIEEDDNGLETITLHSGETYVLDSKYTSNSNSVFVKLSETSDRQTTQSIPSEDPMMAVYNDHTYAMRYSENVFAAKSQLNEAQASSKHEEKSEIILKNALKDLLLNTTILKCLVCSKTPQEMIEFLDNAHQNEECF